VAAANSLPGLDPRDIRDHYDDFSWVYRLCWGEHIHHGLFTNGESAHEAQVALLRHCATLAGVAKGMRVADVGCGHGGTARFLATEYGCDVLGVSISPTQIAVAQKLARSLAKGRSGASRQGSVTFLLANAETHQFPANHFDVVWNMESSEHFFNKAAYFRKISAALKRGGTLMLAAWTGSMRHAVVREIAEVFLCPELLTSTEYIDLIEAAGLSVTSVENVGPQVARTWDICAGQAKLMAPVTAVLPPRFRSFAQGIDFMRKGYRTGELNYSILVAKK
jgi:tocopherol O-methyltransferase